MRQRGDIALARLDLLPDLVRLLCRQFPRLFRLGVDDRPWPRFFKRRRMRRLDLDQLRNGVSVLHFHRGADLVLFHRKHLRLILRGVVAEFRNGCALLDQIRFLDRGSVFGSRRIEILVGHQFESDLLRDSLGFLARFVKEEAGADRFLDFFERSEDAIPASR